MRQADVFLQGEGAAWYERNKDKIDPKNDPVLKMIERKELLPKRVLEVGCANGWRLKELQKKYRCEIRGVDPAAERILNIHIFKGTADNLSMFNDNSFDLIIYGWCLYLCDPTDYFKIAAEGDRVLKDDGHILIYDFYQESGFEYKRKYKHRNGLFSHKMDFSNLWDWHPGYFPAGWESYGNTDNRTAITLLLKDMENIFPVRE